MVFETKEELNATLNGSINGDTGVAVKRGVIDGKNDLLKQIGSLYLNESTSDIRLKVGGQTLPAHKCIVATRSRYFYKHIYGKDIDDDVEEGGGDRDGEPSVLIKGGHTLEMFGTSVDAVKQILKYLYAGELHVDDMTLDLIIDVLTLSHRCRLSQIVAGISDYLKNIVEIDNVWTIYSAASLFNETNSLAEYCLRYMDRSAVKLLNHESTYSQSIQNFKFLITRKTFEAPEVEKFKAVYKWINQNPTMDSKDLVTQVNLARLGQEELLHVVRPTHLVSDSEILDAITPKRKRVSLDTSTNTDQNIKLEAIEFSPKFTIKTLKHETDNVGYYYMVELTEPYEINHIKLRLSELLSGKGEYSYYIESSTDNDKWTKLVDYSNFVCRSWQSLYFEPLTVKFIKVVGTRPDGKTADIIIDSFDCSFSHNPMKQENSFIIPSEDIANLDCGTRIRYPINRHDLYLLHSTQRYAYFIPVRNFGDDLKKNAFNIQLAQPYLLESMEFKIYHKDDKDSYRYYVEVSNDEKSWDRVVDKIDSPSKGMQVLKFEKRPVVFIRIVGTGGVGVGHAKFLGCSSFRCPAISVADE